MWIPKPIRLWGNGLSHGRLKDGKRTRACQGFGDLRKRDSRSPLLHRLGSEALSEGAMDPALKAKAKLKSCSLREVFSSRRERAEGIGVFLQGAQFSACLRTLVTAWEPHPCFPPGMGLSTLDPSFPQCLSSQVSLLPSLSPRPAPVALRLINMRA